MTERSFRDDILGQSANLERAGAGFLARLAAADLRPFRTEPTVFTGMGASFCAVIPSAAWLRTVGHRALAVSPTDLGDAGGRRLPAACVAVSQSGRSTETVAALRALSAPRLALTLDGRGPLAEVADLALPIGSAPDQGVSVLTYTASLFACAAVAAALAGEPPPLDESGLAGLVDDVSRRSVDVADRMADRLATVRAVDAIGGPSFVGSAMYAVLLIREAARVPAAAFDTHAYLHGPVEVAEAGLAAILFGDGREIELARSLAWAGASVLLVTGAAVEADGAMEVLRLPEVPSVLEPILQAIPAQLLGDALARARGLTPGRFRHEQPDTKLGPP